MIGHYVLGSILGFTSWPSASSYFGLYEMVTAGTFFGPLVAASTYDVWCGQQVGKVTQMWMDVAGLLIG